jgi:HPt (histidine-containing phosphotransfer) domain-containing protein
MHAECERRDVARREVASRGFTKKTYDELFRAEHDIKGEAATFGYPTVGTVAHSLCRLIEHTPDVSRIPLTLVEQHVDAVRRSPRICAARPCCHRQLPDAAPARGYRRILARRKCRLAGLSGKYFCAAACARRPVPIA